MIIFNRKAFVSGICKAVDSKGKVYVFKVSDKNKPVETDDEEYLLKAYPHYFIKG